MTRVEHASKSSRIGLLLIAAALVALAAAPYWADRLTLRLMAEAFTFLALASLWNLLAGYAGLVSVGQQAYVGLGGYVLFASTIVAGLHPLIAVPLAGVVGAVVALPAAGLLFRLRGLIEKPLVAIGGITLANAHLVFRSGADSVAIIAGLLPDAPTLKSLRQRVVEWQILLQAL